MAQLTGWTIALRTVTWVAGKSQLNVCFFSQKLALTLLFFFVFVFYYRSWKCWHSPMSHAKAMAVTVSHDMHLEVCEGNLDPALKVEKPVTFFRWREKLAKQMLHCSPKNHMHPGDDKFRCCTKQPSFYRHSPSPAPPRRSLQLNLSSSDDVSTICSVATRDQVEAASERLCGDLSSLEQHEAAMISFKSHRPCESCGKPAYWKCTKCPNGPVMHRVPNKWNEDNISCHVKCHNTLRFGVTRAESTKRKWKEPDGTASDAHAKHMKRVADSIVIANATALAASADSNET